VTKAKFTTVEAPQAKYVGTIAGFFFGFPLSLLLAADLIQPECMRRCKRREIRERIF